MLPVAGEMYQSALDEDPDFAPAWAKLGRVHRILAKFGAEGADEHLRKADEAFKRALEINPDLSVAHNLYTNFEIESLGRAKEAVVRLLGRMRSQAADPELFAGLVHRVPLLRPARCLARRRSSRPAARPEHPHERDVHRTSCAATGNGPSPPTPTIFAGSRTGRCHCSAARAEAIADYRAHRTTARCRRLVRQLMTGLATDARGATRASPGRHRSSSARASSIPKASISSFEHWSWLGRDGDRRSTCSQQRRRSRPASSAIRSCLCDPWLDPDSWRTSIQRDRRACTRTIAGRRSRVPTPRGRSAAGEVRTRQQALTLLTLHRQRRHPSCTPTD